MNDADMSGKTGCSISKPTNIMTKEIDRRFVAYHPHIK